MRYTTPTALRRAIEDRLRARAETTGSSLARLRRRTVLERLLVRLDHNEPGRWILKGGMALELRLGDRARATKDIDLTLQRTDVDSQLLRERMIECLHVDPDNDGFEFTVGPPTQLNMDGAGRPGWRLHVDGRLAGRLFDAVKLDVVARPEEISRTERVSLPGLLAFAGLPTRQVEVVDRHQHFAEKLHALTRDYGSRPNTRTKDLVDLVILIEDGLTASPQLVSSVRHVFTARGTHPPPTELPEPPAAWRERYERAAQELDLPAADLAEASGVVRRFWDEALTATATEHELAGPQPMR